MGILLNRWVIRKNYSFPHSMKRTGHSTIREFNSKELLIQAVKNSSLNIVLTMFFYHYFDFQVVHCFLSHHLSKACFWHLIVWTTTVWGEEACTHYILIITNIPPRLVSPVAFCIVSETRQMYALDLGWPDWSIIFNFKSDGVCLTTQG